MGRFDRRFGSGASSRSERRNEPVEIKNVRALRPAGKTLVVAVVDPRAAPSAPVPKNAEVMIPVSEIHPTSQVRAQPDRGILIIPAWLALDRGLVDEGDL